MQRSVSPQSSICRARTFRFLLPMSKPDISEFRNSEGGVSINIPTVCDRKCQDAEGLVALQHPVIAHIRAQLLGRLYDSHEWQIVYPADGPRCRKMKPEASVTERLKAAGCPATVMNRWTEPGIRTYFMSPPRCFSRWANSVP